MGRGGATGDRWDGRALLAGCRADDPAAWEELVARHRRRLEGLACREFGLSRPDAEDVLQDVLLRARSRLSQVRDPEALGAWLGCITRRVCIDHVRGRRGTEELSDVVGDDRAGQDLDALLARMTLAGAMGELSLGSREVIERFFLRDESYATIGRELGLPPGTIASRIARGLDRLRYELLL